MMVASCAKSNHGHADFQSARLTLDSLGPRQAEPMLRTLRDARHAVQPASDAVHVGVRS